jgi:septum formation protein
VRRQPLVLASGSPRRQSMLRELGLTFDIDAPLMPEPDPSDYPSVELFVTHAAHRKAAEIAARRPDGDWILAADTVAEVDGVALGKPADRKDAERILRTLIGRRHRTWTGICMMRAGERRALLDADASWVTFRTVTDDRLREYLDGGAWEGKAGAYGIQDHDDPFVEKLEGSFTNVMGLPVERVLTLFATAEAIDGLFVTTHPPKKP